MSSPYSLSEPKLSSKRTALQQETSTVSPRFMSVRALYAHHSKDSDHDIDKLIEKTETEGDQQEPQAGEGAAFSFAKIWSADKDQLEDLETDDAVRQAQDDAWAKTLQRIAEERAKEELVEISGRGAKRRAAPVFPQVCRSL